MPLPSSGPISLSQVNVELGRSSTAAISMGESAVRTLFGVASGAISMSQGYGKGNQFAFSFAGGTNVNLRTAAVNAGWNQSTKVVATNTGTISSGSTGSYALTISGSFPGGVEFVNNGVVVGRGGNGGRGGQVSSVGSPGQAALPGNTGGPALLVQTSVTIRNNSTIGGGGGGGGGGGAVAGGFRGTITCGGGGGGGGIGVSSGGAGGVTPELSGAAGTGGTTSAVGVGGTGAFSTSTNFGGNGGNGGSFGASGAGGTQGNTSSSQYYGTGAGGAAGAAIVGNGNITWLTFGTRLGGIS